LTQFPYRLEVKTAGNNVETLADRAKGLEGTILPTLYSVRDFEGE
jgi:hypothetical protein